MNALVWLFTCSLVGGAVFLGGLALRPLSGKIFSKTWHYYSLLVPLIFLLGGALPAGHLVSRVQSHRHQAAYHQVQASASGSVNISLPGTGAFSFPIGIAGEAAPVYEHTTGDLLLALLRQGAPYLLFCWGLGGFLFAATGIKKYLRYRRFVLSHATPLNILCKLPVVTSPAACTPMLMGIIKPVIVLPVMPFTSPALSMVIAHEMVHYRRKDLLYKLVGFTANAIHWFNPAVYTLNRQLNTLCELSCDEKMAVKMDGQDRKLYGETILQVLGHSAEQRNMGGNLLLATRLCSGKQKIKRPAIKCQPLVRKKYLVALPFDFRYFLKGTENNGYKSRDKPQKELKFFNTKIHQTIFMLGW